MRPTEDQLLDMIEDTVHNNILNEYERLQSIIEVHPKMKGWKLHQKWMDIAIEIDDMLNQPDADGIDVGIHAIAEFSKFIKENLEP